MSTKRRTKSKRAPAKAQPPARKLSAPPPGGLKPWHVVAALAIALVVVIWIYQPTFDAPFLFDDQYLPFTHPDYQELPLSRWLIGVRPTLMLSYWINYQMSGSDPASYRVFNIFLHFLTGILVFLIVRRLLERVGAEQWQRELIGAFAGCLFLFHPLQTEAVAYVASRSESLSVFFFYAAFALFLYRKQESISFVEAFFVLALFGCAITSKEHTVMLPFVLLLTDYFWNPGFSLAGVKRNWRLYLPVVVVGGAGGAFTLSKLAESDTAGFQLQDISWHTYFLTQCKAIWIYLRMFVLPWGQNVDHNYPLVESTADPLALAGLAGLLALIVVAWIKRRQFPLAAYGFYTFLLLLAPTSSVVPIKDALVERRVYLPMIGLLLVVAALLRRWKPAPKTAAMAFAAVALIAAFLGAQRAQVWTGVLPLWEDSVAKAPDNWRANFQLAYAYYADQRCSEAAERYEATAKLSEPDYRLLVDWAYALDCANRSDEALEKLSQAAELEEDHHVYATMGLVYGKRGENEKALEALTKAAELNEYFAMTHFYRGNVLTAMERYEEAEQAYGLALTLDDSLDAARRGMERSEKLHLEQRRQRRRQGR